ncbi:glycosyltransferase [Methylocystis sp. SC2]|uniref:glycosyltransferase n=1 Tax=Methylocystis sp. (strain SC2) TaxID=187303 RepID=UPI00027AF3B7|nr:glycosyltransferase [Methylocystis sp. SC2]CCJ07227.1 Glycosyl transferase group 1 [Methylocystis sp. SC2]
MSIHQSAPGRAALSGKTVAVVHPAWHSCGTHQVIASQIKAYKKLGARVLSIALMDDVTPAIGRGARWENYRAHSRDLAADERYESSATIADLFRTALLKDGWLPLIHGDHASWLVELVKRAPLPEALDTGAIDLIHANHFFVMPFVERMRERRRIPVVLDTHDIQARQYELRNRAGFSIPPHVRYNSMLAIELEWIERADLCIHLNSEEYATFGQLLPQSPHELIYPSIAPVAPQPNGDRAIFVAGDNAANYISIRWFLKYIAPHVPEMSISIFGDIADGVKRRDRPLYEKHRNLFRGRIADIDSAYADAAMILLPTREGHGLSIKTVEALSSGLPIVATSKAFRGMEIDPSRLRNVHIANDASEFAAAMVKCPAMSKGSDPMASDTRALYEDRYSLEGFARRLGDVACKLMANARYTPLDAGYKATATGASTDSRSAPFAG